MKQRFSRIFAFSCRSSSFHKMRQNALLLIPFKWTRSILFCPNPGTTETNENAFGIKMTAGKKENWLIFNTSFPKGQLEKKLHLFALGEGEKSGCVIC